MTKGMVMQHCFGHCGHSKAVSDHICKPKQQPQLYPLNCCWPLAILANLFGQTKSFPTPHSARLANRPQAPPAAILPSTQMEAWEAELGVTALPEMIFADNCVTLRPYHCFAFVCLLVGGGTFYVRSSRLT